MKDDSQMLAETVVNGYGSAKKRDLTGSITNIKGDEQPISRLSILYPPYKVKWQVYR